MSEHKFQYVIVGSGRAGTSAVKGIRAMDSQNPILLIGEEKHQPYDRPPLSKKLWMGKKKLEDIYLNPPGYWEENQVTLSLGERVQKIEPETKRILTGKGMVYQYEKLLLATGGKPKLLPIPGGDIHEIYYYRDLSDYLRLREEAKAGQRVAVVGGGFIGSEMAAALQVNKLEVTMIFPEEYLCARVFPEDLGEAIQRRYEEKGIKILTGDKPVRIERGANKFRLHTGKGEKLESDLIVAGAGIVPETTLAEAAGLKVENGISVNLKLQTSDPAIYAAGDNAFFFYAALEKNTRIEHWDNALNQGLCAGRNMAGASAPYGYMPYFFSDLFDFGYEAVGEVDSRLEIHARWEEKHKKGIVYYLRDGKVCGVLLCNVWEKVEAARGLIANGRLQDLHELDAVMR